MEDGGGMFFVVLFGIIIGGGIGAIIGKRKAREAEGFLLGFLLGPIGWILACFLDSKNPKCPHCHGEIDKGVTKCRHCGGDIVWE